MAEAPVDGSFEAEGQPAAVLNRQQELLVISKPPEAANSPKIQFMLDLQLN